jgi:acylglycerol lipase
LKTEVRSTHLEFNAVTTDGLTLYGQSWVPSDPVAIVALAHGLAEHGGRYGRFASQINQAGIGVVTLDLRGHGRSPGEALLVNRFDDYLFDIDALFEATRKMASNCPVFLMGHSLGGAIALRWLSQRSHEIVNLGGLVLSSAALKIGPGTPSFLVKLAPLVSKYFPRLRVHALNPELISGVAEEVARYREDPLVCHLPPPARTGAEVLAIMPVNLTAASKITLPLYIFHGTDDTLTSPEGSQELYAIWGGTDRCLRLWAGSLHETLNDIDRDAVTDALTDWLLSRAVKHGG